MTGARNGGWKGSERLETNLQQILRAPGSTLMSDSGHARSLRRRIRIIEIVDGQERRGVGLWTELMGKGRIGIPKGERTTNTLLLQWSALCGCATASKVPKNQQATGLHYLK